MVNCKNGHAIHSSLYQEENSISISLAFESGLAWCSGLNVCVSLQFINWNIISNVMILQDGAFRRSLGHTDESFINGMSALIKKDQRASWVYCCVCEDIMRSWQFSTQKKALTRPPPCWHPDLGLYNQSLELCYSNWSLLFADLLWLIKCSGSDTVRSNSEPQ